MEAANEWTSGTGGLRDKAQRRWQGYADKASESPELPRYATAITAFAGYCGAVAAVAVLTGRRPPAQLSPLDLVIGAGAVFRGSRLISKNSVTSPLRAPFTEYVEPGAPAEVNEKPRGNGVQGLVGELVTCPFCVSVWAAATYLAGLTLLPRATRLAAGGLTSLAAADFLHLAYTSLDQATKREE
ncbi:DUF1360 domain-containing protein [Kribbella sp. NPDC023855]|uniref:DUF1360 domain-containing protein n=1 Tax=Kribbella sp. NPDC023855 TaxID=3154698 RepID=UPI0034108D7C